MYLCIDEQSLKISLQYIGMNPIIPHTYLEYLKERAESPHVQARVSWLPDVNLDRSSTAMRPVPI